MEQATTVAQACSLAQELPHVVGVAKKKKKSYSKSNLIISWLKRELLYANGFHPINISKLNIVFQAVCQFSVKLEGKNQTKT